MVLFHVVDKTVYGMAAIRILSSLIEFSAAMLMLYVGTAQRALQVNAALALVGPMILVSVTMLGLWNLAGSVSLTRIAFILVGVGFILYGARG